MNNVEIDKCLRNPRIEMLLKEKMSKEKSRQTITKPVSNLYFELNSIM